MDIVGYWKGGSARVDVSPGDGDTVTMFDYGLGGILESVFKDGTKVATDKCDYPSMGGVALLGGDGKHVYFVTNPCWAAAISKAATALNPDATDKEPVVTHIRPMKETDAVEYLKKKLGRYPVDGYEYGPDMWNPSAEMKEE